MNLKKINAFLGVPQEAKLSTPVFLEKRSRVVVIDSIVVIVVLFIIMHNIKGSPNFPPIVMAPAVTILFNFFLLQWLRKRAESRGTSGEEYRKAFRISTVLALVLPGLLYFGLFLFLLPFGLV